MSLLTAARVCFTGAARAQDASSSPSSRRCGRRSTTARAASTASPAAARRCRSLDARVDAHRRERPGHQDRLPAARALAAGVRCRLPAAPGRPRDGGRRADRDRRAHVPRARRCCAPTTPCSRFRSPPRRRRPGTPPLPGFRRVPPPRRRAHPDRRRSPAVPARPAGRLPPFPHRRGHRHLLHASRTR